MYLYSNIVGTFVFNQNFQIREKVLFKEKDIPKIAKQLENREELDTEKEFLRKFKSIKSLTYSDDPADFEKISPELEQYREEFYKNNLYLTGEQVRESVTDDLLILQLSSSVVEISKAINMLSKRLREMYGHVLPELDGIITDHQHFAELVAKKSAEELKKEFDIKRTMGTGEDNTGAKDLAATILDLYRHKERQEKNMEAHMDRTCPNLVAVAGYSIGAKLIVIAGSLRNMVMMPASTIQLLGAEKALFRHMTRNAKAPKHGIIIDHPLLQKAEKGDKGKAARALADKISMAVKVDYFKGKFIGDKLKKELEEKFK
ncbi:TPA: hypothetical protein HA239_01140 [Candidatus Woesearchaeota archaeon]|nr:Pre-mRNA splicing, snoRNA binding protein, NOP5/NOP56 related protein [archaeon GW2011_AR15]MBS3103706.1 hypothetical protein [Candidatus Woesearchaeota archaeon]HIH40998.1 hypothetical protein [Candidatus Woesearchaeota archaeon]